MSKNQGRKLQGYKSNVERLQSLVDNARSERTKARLTKELEKAQEALTKFLSDKGVTL